MNTLISIFIVLFIHWIADFVVQTTWQAQNKSKNIAALTYHVVSYTTVWAIVYGILCLLWGFGSLEYSPVSDLTLWWFFPITFAAHWITDYFTSKLTTKLYLTGDYHNFFVVIGFDQILHYVQLFLTLHFLT
jgi:cellobiose-specific phosphotransferase system component IIC